MAASVHPAQWVLGKFSACFFGFSGFFAPWNVLYFALTVAPHHYTTPPLEACRTFAASWLAQLFLRNVALLWIFAGGRLARAALLALPGAGP
jgi:hypothetical protein